MVESEREGTVQFCLADYLIISTTPLRFSPHIAYTMAKFGMSMAILGWSGELKQYGIAANGKHTSHKFSTVD
jgi:hypothetical protein